VKTSGKVDEDILPPLAICRAGLPECLPSYKDAGGTASEREAGPYGQLKAGMRCDVGGTHAPWFTPRKKKKKKGKKGKNKGSI
jgi:hypothetical protein